MVSTSWVVCLICSGVSNVGEFSLPSLEMEKNMRCSVFRSSQNFQFNTFLKLNQHFPRHVKDAFVVRCAMSI